MSDHIDTRDGWRETTGEAEPYRDQHALIEHDESGKVLRSWVRTESSPAPSTVITTLDGSDLIFVSEVLRALGTWKQAQS